MFEKKVLELLNEKQLKIYNETSEWIKGLPLSITALVEEFESVVIGRKTVVCTAILKSGYEITAYSSPVSISDFNMDLGRILAKKKVLEEIIGMNIYYKMAKASDDIIMKSPEIISDGNSYDVVDEVIGETTKVTE